MSCTCQEITCNECNPLVDPLCSCPVKLDSVCVLYQGDTLTTLSVDAGDTLTAILVLINDYLATLDTSLYTNIGTGEGIFKQINVLSQAEFKSIISSDTSLSVVSTAEEIDITLNGVIAGEANTASNIGAQIELFKQKTGVDLEFRTLQGLGATTVTQNIDIIEISSTDTNTTYTGSNLGGGEEVFKQLNAVDFEHRTLVGVDDITVNTNVDVIEIGRSAAAVTEQIERAASFTLDNTMNEQVIYLTNTSPTDIDIIVPSTLDDNFKVGFIQIGDGDVTITEDVGVTVNTKDGYRIQGQNYQAFLQKRNFNAEFNLLGNTKI